MASAYGILGMVKHQSKPALRMALAYGSLCVTVRMTPHMTSVHPLKNIFERYDTCA